MVTDSLEPFEIDKDYLRKEIKIPKNDQRRKWFFSEALTNQVKETFREKWYKYIESNRIDVPMFTYFEIYASNNKIDYPFLEINMFQKG